MSALLTRIMATTLLLALVACSGTPAGLDEGDDGTDFGGEEETSEPAETADGDGNGEGSGGGGGDAGELGPDAACDLLTPEEVEAAVGVEVTGTVGDGSEGSYQCLYEGSGSISVLTIIYNTVEAQFTFDTFERSQPEVEQVSGLGDEAIWFDPQVLMVREGDSVILLYNLAFGQDEATARAASEQLARIALGRM